MQMLDDIQKFAFERPDSPAVSAGGSNLETLSYRDLLGQIGHTKELFANHSENTAFVFVIANRSNFLATAIVAALAAGRPIAIIDYRLGPHRIGQILSRGGRVFGVVDNIGERTLTKIPDALMQNLDYLRVDSAKEAKQQMGLSGNLDALTTPSDTAVILFTSGSTGEPKGVQISRSDLQRRLDTEKDWFGMTQADQILGVLPLSFDVGLTQMLATFSAGGHHVLLNSWLPKDIIARINQFKPDGLAMSPIVWKNLLNSPNPSEWWEAANQLRYLTLSGGTLGSSDLQSIKSNLTKCSLIKTYGQTEMFRIASLRLNEAPEKLESVGRAYPGVQLEIRDQSGKICGAGEEGEIIAGGSGLMQGYFGADSDAVQNFNSESIRTGDYGFLDEDGFLFVKGRRDHMVKILDQRVYPDDVADSIQQITGLSDVVVIDVVIDDAPALIAFVKLDAQQKGADEQIQAFFKLLRGQLASHLIPRDIIALDSIPHTPSGKIDRVTLKERYDAERKSH